MLAINQNFMRLYHRHFWMNYEEMPQNTIEHFNSQKLLKSNFFLQYPYIIQQTGNKNTQTYQVEVVVLI